MLCYNNCIIWRRKNFPVKPLPKARRSTTLRAGFLFAIITFRKQCFLFRLRAAERYAFIWSSEQTKQALALPSLDEWRLEMTKTLQDKIIEADERAARFLSNANEAAEMGKQEKAERLYAKSQFWLDRLNKLLCNS